jgi:hypothetical protein
LEITAIWISIFSAILAATSLGWNIYRDIILKPKLKISFSVRVLVGEGVKNKSYVFLEGTNFGPGKINCQMITGMNACVWKRKFWAKEHFIVFHDYKNLLSGQLPKTLEVGERISLLLPYSTTKDCILTTSFTHIGISDSFGRTHYANSKDIRGAKNQFIKDFCSIPLNPTKQAGEK